MATNEPALLQIAPRFSVAPTAGAEFRCLYLGARLARHMNVTHAGFLTDGSSEPAVARPENAAPNHRFVAVPRGGSYRITDLVRGTVGRVPFSVLNYTRRAMRETVARLQAETRFDIVQLEGIHLGEYLPLVRSGNPHAVVACDWHNIESEILRRYSQSAAGWARRQYARHAAGKLAQYERWFVNQCDLHLVVSERDRDVLLEYGARVPVVVIENGVPLEQFSLPVEAAGAVTPRFRVVFTGAMDYHANIDAVTTFAREVWPEVHAAVPQLVFTIVGRKPSPAVSALSGREGIEVTGMVPDVRPYYGEAVAAVIPLRVGGGTRIKILEAMAAGVPVVSTAVGAEGLAATPGTHYIRADSNAEMVAAFEGLLHNPAMVAAMVAAAREFVLRHDWAYLGDRLAEQLLVLRDARAQGANR